MMQLQEERQLRLEDKRVQLERECLAQETAQETKHAAEAVLEKAARLKKHELDRCL